ncbi:MAG: hypothetical protein ACOH2F_19880 [Cellulomonas sp.]
MLQRLIAIVLGVLGLASIALGVASATAWRAQDTLVATTSAAPASAGTLLVAAPGVLELGGTPVTVTARANGGTKVVLAIGREADVAGWVGTDPSAVIAGLSDLRTLRLEPAAAEPTAEPSPVPSDAPADAAAPADPAADAAAPTPATAAPDPDGSDLWVSQAVGERSAELMWTPQPGRWTLLVAGVGDGAKAPTVVLSWPQTVTTPWLVPGVVVGVVLLALGIALGLRLWLRARRGEQALWHDVETGALPIVRAHQLASTGRGSSASGSAGLDSAGLDSAGLDSAGLDSAGLESTGPGAAAPGSAEVALADDAPTIVLTRRQMREAAATAPTPRVSLRKRAARSAGDDSRPATGSVPVTPVIAVAPATTSGTTTPGTGASSPHTGASSPHTADRVGAVDAAPAGVGVAGVASDGKTGVASAAGPDLQPGDDSTAALDSRPARRFAPSRWLGSRRMAAGSSPTPGTTAQPATAAAQSAPPATSPAVVPPAGPGAVTPWVPGRPAEPPVPDVPAASPHGSRADAWRRSWGIPDGAAAGSASASKAPVPPADPSDVTDPPGHAAPADPRSGKDD